MSLICCTVQVTAQHSHYGALHLPPMDWRCLDHSILVDRIWRSGWARLKVCTQQERLITGCPQGGATRNDRNASTFASGINKRASDVPLTSSFKLRETPQQLLLALGYIRRCFKNWLRVIDMHLHIFMQVTNESGIGLQIHLI